MVKRVELRIGRDSALTWEEMDSNLMALDSASPFRVSADHITYDGKVGIGPSADSTYHPTYHLDFNEGDSNNEATIGTTDADLHVHVDGPRSLKVSTNTQERLTLTTQGNLGINQPDPEFPLDIDGNARIKGTFRGNQFRAFSFSDSDDLTISRGNITNAKRIVSTEQIDFAQLYSRDNGYRVDHIDTVIVDDPNGFPTTRAVFEAMESDRSSGASDLDSEHAWNVAEHNQLQTNLDSLRTETIESLDSLRTETIGSLDSLRTETIESLDSLRTETIGSLDSLRTETGELLDSLRTETILSLDSEHLWNLSEHQDLQNNIDSLRSETIASFDSEHAWNVAQHNQLQSSLDSEHAWNVSEHNSIHASLDSEHAWNVAEHNQLQSNLDSLRDETIASFDSEHAWNVAQHNQLQANIDSVNAELIAQGTARHDSEHAWNVSEHNQLQTNMDSLRDETVASFDSEHAWNLSEHNQLQSNLDAEAQARSDADSDINARIDSEHAWNVIEHNQLQTNLDSLRTETLASLDSEHSWNLSENNQLQVNIDSVNTSLNGHINVINGKFDSVNGNLNQLQVNINNLGDSLSGKLDSLEGSVNGSLDSDITVLNNKLDSAENRLDNRIDSEHAWNVAEHDILQSQFDNLTTDSVAEGDINLYYTNARVDARNDSTIDSNFLNDRMPLGNLSDVQLTTPDLNEVLQWNGSVWSNQSIGIVGTVEFRGTVDATVDAAPASPTNGDFYINLGRGNALASWVGLSTVDSGDGLAWDSNATNWRNLGKTSSSSVVRVQAGTAISVDETDAARPVVAVRKDVTDTWYYTQSQIDSIVDAEHAWNVSEHSELQSSLDSEHAWNLVEHDKLDTKIDDEAAARTLADSALGDRIDSEHAWNLVEHDQLQTNINNLDSNLLAAIDSLGLNIDGDLTLEISNIQSQIDSLSDRVDSEHAWNVVEHGKLDSSLDSEHAWNVEEHDGLQSSIDLLIDSLNSHISITNNKFDSVDGSLNQLQININNLDSDVNDRLDSLQLYVDNVVSINIGDLDSDLSELQQYVDSYVAVEIAKLDSALDSEHAWNVREHGKLDSALDSEHAWNVSEHLALDSSLRAALDSLGENITAGLVISEDAPTDPSDGDLWMSTTEETVYIYDGEFWFEFPGTGNTYASLAIGDTAPNEPSQGTMWMDNTEGVVKIYDGDFWFDWPWPDISSGDFGYLDSVSTESMIDSALSVFEGGLDSASVQEMVDSTLSNPLTIANSLTIDAAGDATFSGNVGIGTDSPTMRLNVSHGGTGVENAVHIGLSSIDRGMVLGTYNPASRGDVAGVIAAQDMSGELRFRTGGNTDAETRLTIDATGNATFSGTVTANKIDGGTY
jgi:plasmid stabilization system protein ParE